MGETPRMGDASCDGTNREAVQAIKENFISAWQRVGDGGTPPTIDEFLADTREPDRSALRDVLNEVTREFCQQTAEMPPDADPNDPGHDKTSPFENTQSMSPGESDEQAASGLAATFEFVPSADESETASSRETPLPTIPGYEVLGELGHGGMGVVYLARQTGLDRYAAVKMIRAGSHAAPSELTRFHIEAEAVARLQHPNIVQIYEVGEHQGSPFFSLEYVDGEDLHRKLGGDPMEIRKAATTMETLARAMHYAHQHGVIHRDLKPANILIANEGEPKITDFGLAKRLEDDSSQTRSGAVVGTPSYMAPEQASGGTEEVGPLADIYGLGAVLYALLTGRPPFMSASVVDTLNQVLDKEPVPPRQLQPKVPLDLETICLKCLQKDPARRYVDSEELAEDLRRFLAGEPIRARPVSRWECFWRWCRRNPRVATLSATAATLALTVVIGSPVAAFLINGARIAAVGAKAEAENSASEALTAKSLAEQAEAQAERNAQEALEAKSQAEAAEATAAERATVATQQATLALDAYQTLIGEVHDQLAGKPEMQDLKEGLLSIAVEKLKEVAANADTANLIDKEMAKAHQKMGMLFEDLGRTRLALERHREAHEIIEELAVQTPQDLVAAKRNPAATANKLGDAYLRLGDPAKAREYYQHALDLRTEWARADPDQLSAELAVANSYGLLGKVDLMLGAPASAHEHFGKSQRWREGMPERVDRMVEIQRQWAGLHDRLGDTNHRLGSVEASEREYARALEIRERLVRARPKSVFHKQDVVISIVNLADLRLQAFQDAEGAEAYLQDALQRTEALRSSDPRSAFPRRALSMIHYRMGTVSLMLGKPDVAADYFTTCLQQRETLASGSPEDASTKIDFMLALARCGRHKDAITMATSFQENLPESSWLHYQICCIYSACAAGVDEGSSDTRALCEQYVDMAIDSLQKAVELGWQDVTALQCNPDLEPIRSHSSFADAVNGTGSPASHEAS